MQILIAGANGGVAQALGNELAQRGHSLMSISRGDHPLWSQHHLCTDCSMEKSVSEVGQWLAEKQLEPVLVIQCAGLLHHDPHMPEKSLARISMDWLKQNMAVNLGTHIHLAQAIDPLIKRKKTVHWVSLSALVGSISENQLGGWYSYRMSKAALNMFIRNLSIEWGRRSPGSMAVALHPGTTDTELSVPFQKNIAAGKLYTPKLTGQRLADVLENLDEQQNGRLLHWDGSIVNF